MLHCIITVGANKSCVKVFYHLPQAICATDSFNAAWTPGCWLWLWLWLLFAAKLLWFPTPTTAPTPTPAPARAAADADATCAARTCGICVTFQYPVAWFLFSYFFFPTFLCWFCKRVLAFAGAWCERGRLPTPTATWSVASHKSNACPLFVCRCCCCRSCLATFRPLSCLLSPSLAGPSAWSLGLSLDSSQ